MLRPWRLVLSSKFLPTSAHAWKRRVLICWLCSAPSTKWICRPPKFPSASSKSSLNSMRTVWRLSGHSTTRAAVLIGMPCCVTPWPLWNNSRPSVPNSENIPPPRPPHTRIPGSLHPEKLGPSGSVQHGARERPQKPLSTPNLWVCDKFVGGTHWFAARFSQNSSQRPLSSQQRRAMIALAPRTVHCMPDCLRRSPIRILQPASTTPDPTKKP
jgi:hypothetical protein